MHGSRAGDCAEAAVRPRHDTVSADEVGEPDDPFGDELRMLDEVRGRVDDAGDQVLVVWKLDVPPDRPLVRLTRVCRLEEQYCRLRSQDGAAGRGNRNIEHGRARVDYQADR